MTFEQLKIKALSLPYAPGVYIMQDDAGQVIYVGKAKKLKNRVSQYFQDTASHNEKTRRMVSQIHSFDTIVATSEFEALVLECSLIKRHMPRYNILLKDDKGYPYIRLDMKKLYPVMELVGKTAEDGADYYGPYGGRYVTQRMIDAIGIALKLPDCSRVFPRDIGKGRPCLNRHLGNCDGWCTGNPDAAEFRARIGEAIRLLRGDYRQLITQLRRDMDAAAEALRFEEAAVLRDRMKALEALHQKQFVAAAGTSQTDVVGYYESESKACFAVLHFLGGELADKDYQILTPAQDEAESVSALVKQYYLSLGTAPKEILLPCPMEDAPLFSQLLQDTYGKKVSIRTPQRGSGMKLVQLAEQNAREEAERVTSREERALAALKLLQNLLGLPVLPRRAEAFDISNTSGTDIVASMTVFADGKPSRKDYKRFRIRGQEGQDDYASMRQAVSRRFARFVSGDAGFSSLPDIVLIDGGAVHASCAAEELEKLGLALPVYGMVKDDRHRTRALVTADGREISISGNPALFSLIGRIQEETHRFAITYHKSLQSRRMKTSELDRIAGIGPVRRQALLKKFKCVKAIRNAEVDALAEVLPKQLAQQVYDCFHEEG